VARTGIRDERVLGVLRRMPRAGFVPGEHAWGAYEDEPVPIPHRQVTTQPSLIARMVEALELDGPEKVLEVGTGHGFQTAILAELTAFVWSVERFADLAETARANLADAGIRNAEVVVGDGTLGLPQNAPYDAILVSAAFTHVPEPLVEQLARDGRLVQPLGPGGAEDVVLFERTAGGLRRVRSLTGAHFVRLVGAEGFADDVRA
jgi:protein-L-isoaspartate(D-aspartate) O-methyltransferase